MTQTLTLTLSDAWMERLREAARARSESPESLASRAVLDRLRELPGGGGPTDEDRAAAALIQQALDGAGRHRRRGLVRALKRHMGAEDLAKAVGYTVDAVDQWAAGVVEPSGDAWICLVREAMRALRQLS